MINFDYLLLFFISLIIQLLFVKKGLVIGKLFGILDKPSKGKIHLKTTPLVGCFPVVLVGLIYLIYFNKNIGLIPDINLIYFFSITFFFIGILDDKYNLNAYFKLFVSAAIFILISIYFSNFSVKLIYIETLDKYLSLDKELSAVFTTLCILLLLNALNLSDGINGLASGYAGFCILILSTFILKNESYFLFFSIFIIINTFIIIKGYYFLGDSGTLFLGCFISLSLIFIYNDNLASGNILSVEKIFILLMIPGIDMFRLFIERLKNKKDPFSRDLDHLHHMLLKLYRLKITLILYFFIFFLTNFLSLKNLIKPITIILLYLFLYVFFIFLYKKKFKNSS
tara:strand:+ start:352 stop:1371 length:1020 start_codon:yes stop_codon:yes gene_type:complete